MLPGSPGLSWRCTLFFYSWDKTSPDHRGPSSPQGGCQEQTEMKTFCRPCLPQARQPESQQCLPKIFVWEVES